MIDWKDVQKNDSIHSIWQLSYFNYFTKIFKNHRIIDNPIVDDIDDINKNYSHFLILDDHLTMVEINAAVKWVNEQILMV